MNLSGGLARTTFRRTYGTDFGFTSRRRKGSEYQLDRLANAGHISKLKIGAKTCYSQDEIIRFANKLIQKGAIYLA